MRVSALLIANSPVPVALVPVTNSIYSIQRTIRRYLNNTFIKFTFNSSLFFSLTQEILLKVKVGPQKKPSGFQAQLVCLTPWNNGEPPSHITALTINSSYGL